MDSSDPALVDFIRETIRERGPVPFRWFMEQALYHPAHGYYSSGRCAIGRRGDYFTNVSVGPLFGRLLAAQFVEIWELLGRPDHFTIVEEGAHHGDFARDVLEAARERAPQFFAALRYRIIEPFPILQGRQTAALASFCEKVEWRKSVDVLGPFCGVHFSNEFLDAMPVHLLTAKYGSGLSAATGPKWQEKYVEVAADRLAFRDGPISTHELRVHLRKISRPPALPYETEVNLEALRWIQNVSYKLERGYVLISDYGYPRDEFYAEERSNGTLRSYAQHRIVSSPLTNIGQTDITAHVEWTSLAERAEESGLRVAGFTDQHHFITGLATILRAEEFAKAGAARDRRTLQTLLHPGLLGRSFQFLALAKGISQDLPLSGFTFARKTGGALGLTAA